MAERPPATVKETMYRLQHYLLEGIQNERQLLASGSIDNKKKVTFRSTTRKLQEPSDTLT